MNTASAHTIVVRGEGKGGGVRRGEGGACPQIKSKCKEHVHWKRKTERFGLDFAKTGSINSGHCIQIPCICNSVWYKYIDIENLQIFFTSKHLKISMKSEFWWPSIEGISLWIKCCGWEICGNLTYGFFLLHICKVSHVCRGIKTSPIEGKYLLDTSENSNFRPKPHWGLATVR